MLTKRGIGQPWNCSLCVGIRSNSNISVHFFILVKHHKNEQVIYPHNVLFPYFLPYFILAIRKLEEAVFEEPPANLVLIPGPLLCDQSFSAVRSG